MAVEHAAPSALAHFDPTELLDALSTGIVMLDAQLCPMYANVAAQDLLAFSLKLARGRPFTDLLHEPDSLSGILKRVLASGESIADRELAVRPAGAPRGAHAGSDRESPERTHRQAPAAGSRRHHAAPAHLARERSAGAAGWQPPHGAAAGTRDQKSARRPARRRAAAGARAAGRGAQGIHPGDHRRGRPPHRAGRFHDRPGAPAEQDLDERARDL